jgi:hypothetical protein
VIDIFVSYASGDRPEAERVANFLEEQGYVVWWDRDLIGGEDFHRTIERMIKECRTAIVIWSETSVESRWVLGEAETAANAGKLIPVRFDSLSPSKLPIAFRALQTPALSDWPGILKAIKQQLGAPRLQQGFWDVAATRIVLRTRHLLGRLTLARMVIAAAVVVVVGYLALDVMDWLRIRASVEITDFKQHRQWFPVGLFSARLDGKLAGESEWQAIESSKLPTELSSFINKYPESVYADFARLRLGRLEAIAAGRYTPLIPDSSTRLLSQTELQPLHCDQLWTARNEIFYVLGYCFVSKTAIDAFHTSVDCPRSCQIVKSFNQRIFDRVEAEVEKANINAIRAMEQQNHCQIAQVPGPCDDAR